MRALRALVTLSACRVTSSARNTQKQLTLWTDHALCALRTLRALSALLALRALRTLRTSCTNLA